MPPPHPGSRGGEGVAGRGLVASGGLLLWSPGTTAATPTNTAEETWLFLFFSCLPFVDSHIRFQMVVVCFGLSFNHNIPFHILS